MTTLTVAPPSHALMLLEQLEQAVSLWPGIKQRTAAVVSVDEPAQQRNEKRKQWLESKKIPQVQWITQHVAEMIGLMRAQGREVKQLCETW